jgi:hypothetical protein
MVMAIWTSSLSLAIVTSSPAVWLTDLVFESIDVPVSGLNPLLVLSSAIHWAVIGVLIRAILLKISR